jgi:hypothetical protein
MPGVSKTKRLVLSRLFLACASTALSDHKRFRVDWRVLQVYVVAIRPGLDFGFVDNRFCAAFLLVLEHVHGLQCRYDVVWDDVCLLAEIEDCKSLLGGTRKECTCECCGPVVLVSQATEVR